jgi:hypothetical protein
MSRTAKDEAATFLRDLDEHLLNGPIESVGIVDVRDYGGITRGLVQRRLKKALEEGRDRRRERREQRGIDASPSYVNRWHLVGDFDGALASRFGVGPEPAHPVAFVVDRCGVVNGPLRDVGRVLTAVAHAVSSSKSRKSAAARPSRPLHTAR